MVTKILVVVQVVLSCLMMVVILLQQKGVGLGAAFGGSSNIYTSKKGFDKVLFRATIVISVLFFLTALASVIF